MIPFLKLFIFVIIASVLFGIVSNRSDTKWAVKGLSDFLGVIAGIFAYDTLKESNHGMFFTYIILTVILLWFFLGMREFLSDEF